MPGQIVHLEIPAGDTAQGREFWSSLFGWNFEPAPGAGDYHMARNSEQSGVAVSGMEGDKKGTRPYFDIDDVNAGAARVRELGGKADDPQPVPSMGWFATCTDPHGNEFGLWQSDPSAQPPSS